MPKILFASNNVSHFPGSAPGSAAGTFDPARVPYGLSLTNYLVANSPTFIANTGTSTWFHFLTYCGSSPFAVPNPSQGILFQCFDGSNRLLARITKLASVYPHHFTLTLYNGSTTLAVNSALPLVVGKLSAVDIQITVTSVSIVCNVYVNGALSASTSYGSNPNAMTNPNRFGLGCAFSDTLTTPTVFSEVFVADADTRNARINFLRPASTGAYADWLGTVASLGDDDPTTGIQTKLAAQRFTAALSEYTGASNISNLVSISQTTRGQNSPTKLKHTLRLSGINYDSSDISIGNSLQYNIVDLQINPATSLPFTAADLAAIETGFLSVA